MFKSITDLYSIFDNKELALLVKEANLLAQSSNTIVNDFWVEEVREYSKPVYTYNITSTDKSFKIINKKSKDLFGIVPDGIFYYFWGPGSYIPWHDDTNYYSALTIYLNEDWNIKYGGLFQYKVEEEVTTKIPRLNTGVYQVGGIEHSTTIQSPDSPLRKSIQCWYNPRKIQETLI